MTDSPQTEWKPIGMSVQATEDGPPVEVVESLCMQCHEQGLTRMLLTVIPFFREVIVVSFRCEHCGYTNNDIQSAGEIQPSGAVYTVKMTERSDLDRQLVKGEQCTIFIPEYQLQIPSGRGQFTTVEGVITDTIRDLSHDQAVRKIQHPELHDQLEAVLDKLRVLVSEDEEMPKFTVKLDDPSGNSFIETRGGINDPKWSKHDYERTAEQNEVLGLAPEEPKPSHYVEEVMSFPGTCSLCGSELETLMKTVNIPHFKDIIIMSANCFDCGYRDNEVKSGGAIAEQGRKITLKVEESDDLSRDILKSETAGLSIPEIDLELNPGTLGGRFTTLEGLLQQVYEELDMKVFAKGDAALDGAEQTATMAGFLQQLKKVMAVEIPFTLILDDPLSNSYIQNLYAPDEDPNMITELYDRDHEQNEELGLNDINTEDYGHEQVDEVKHAKEQAAKSQRDAIVESVTRAEE